VGRALTGDGGVAGWGTWWRAGSRGQTTWDIYASLLRQGLSTQRRFMNAKNGDDSGLPRADRQGVLESVAAPVHVVRGRRVAVLPPGQQLVLLRSRRR